MGFICHLTQVNAPCHKPSKAGHYSTCLRLQNGKAHVETLVLLIVSDLTASQNEVQCPNHYITKPAHLLIQTFVMQSQSMLEKRRSTTTPVYYYY